MDYKSASIWPGVAEEYEFIVPEGFHNYVFIPNGQNFEAPEYGLSYLKVKGRVAPKNKNNKAGDYEDLYLELVSTPMEYTHVCSWLPFLA